MVMADNTYKHRTYRGNNGILVEMPGIPTIQEEMIMARNFVERICCNRVPRLSVYRLFTLLWIGHCGLVTNNALLTSLGIVTNDRRSVRDALYSAKLITDSGVLVLFPLESISPRLTKREFLTACFDVAKNHYSDEVTHKHITEAISQILEESDE
jgi:hypothetical protein